MQTSLTFSNVGTSGVLPDLDRAFKRGISVIRARCRASVLHIFLHPSPQWYNATLHGGETCPEMEVQCTRLYVHIFPACGHRCACIRCSMWTPAASTLPQRVQTAAPTSSRAWTTAASRAARVRGPLGPRRGRGCAAVEEPRGWALLPCGRVIWPPATAAAAPPSGRRSGASRYWPRKRGLPGPP